MLSRQIVLGCASFAHQALALPISPYTIRTAAATNSSIGDFGSCSVPEIKFASGFDNRKETSFEPVDQVSYNHGSAQNIDIITQFMCDALVNTCGADQMANDTCTNAKTAADGQTAKTGAQVDAFNAVFGIQTNFAAVTPIDDQGNPVDITGASGAAPASAALTATATASSSTASTTGCSVASGTSTANSTTDTAGSASASSSTAGAANATSLAVGNFGSCSTPQIQFGAGFDGRKETAFEPVDKTSFNHGSADNIAVITQFMCDALTNTCNADQIAKDTCATADAAANAATAKSGAQADAFNTVFGIQTNFAAVQEIDDTGKPIAGIESAPAGPSAAATSAALEASSAPSAAYTAAITLSSSSASEGGNLEKFIGSLGSVTAPAVTTSGNGQF